MEIRKHTEMKKENVKVLIGSKKEAKAVRRVLEALGEQPSIKQFYKFDCPEKWLIFDPKEHDWMLANPQHSGLKKRSNTITLKQLVQLLAGEEVKPKDGTMMITRKIQGDSCDVHILPNGRVKVRCDYMGLELSLSKEQVEAISSNIVTPEQ